ncbi:MAG: L-arabinose ABC transporter ATP-binding protein AraG [Caulobacter sp.]|nr:L-arabinose ABC transporter ATP-binding protein AraG [Caulobacter sp.]
MSPPLLELEEIGKSFPGVIALDGVSVSVSGGEIRALMGENGAGKSTLLKVLGGEHRQDGGTIRVAGEAFSFFGPAEPAAAGIAIIHQELHLAPDMTVAENLSLGAMPRRGPFLDARAMRRRAVAVLKTLGEDIHPDTKVKDLPIGRRQMVEIGKALLRDARIIAFDEPTSSLSARETEILMRIIRDLKAQGRAIIYVSHRMEEVFDLCDSVSILRDGRLVSTHADMKAVSQDQLITEMAGRSIADVYNYQPRDLGETTVSVRGLLGPGLSRPVSFEARRGEVLGFFGLVGAGRSELMHLIYGGVRAEAGDIEINGARMLAKAPPEAIAAGLGLAPEDRKGQGIIPLASVRDNIVMADRNLKGRGPLRDTGREKRLARTLIETLRVKTASAETPISALSGGNQQKAILARWLAAEAQILLLDEPTRGIDVGSRSEIYSLMYSLAAEGRTLLVVSSDMPEVLGVCDRILVMREGALAGELSREAATPDALLRLALPAASDNGDPTLKATSHG